MLLSLLSRSPDLTGLSEVEGITGSFVALQTPADHSRNATMMPVNIKAANTQGCSHGFPER